MRNEAVSHQKEQRALLWHARSSCGRNKGEGTSWMWAGYTQRPCCCRLVSPVLLFLLVLRHCSKRWVVLVVLQLTIVEVRHPSLGSHRYLSAELADVSLPPHNRKGTATIKPSLEAMGSWIRVSARVFLAESTLFMHKGGPLPLGLGEPNR